MSIEYIEREFVEKVCDQIHLREEGVNKYRVFTPFRSDDGDHLVIVLKQELDKWILTDNGHTYMHLTYNIDEKSLHTGTRQKIVSNTLNTFSVDDVGGELRLTIENSQFGNALYDFIQALLRINDVSYLSRERIKSTFMEDFREFIEEQVPEERRRFDWHHPQYDPEGSYSVDCRINGIKQPLMFFALPTDTKTRDATITLLQFERWGLDFRSVSIFRNQEEINRKVLARFSDVSDKQYSNLTANRDRIPRFLNSVLAK
ncbi:MAG: DUF1828 domain-containing protein [Chloroflexota bacterium]|nr:DUF1828 domain-containing protein [Chloroflexota bacterium]